MSKRSRRILNTRSGPLALAIYIFARSVVAVMRMFPLSWNLKTARLLAQGWMRLLPRHRQRAIDNLTAAMRETHEPTEIARMAERCLESWTMFAVEVMCLPQIMDRYNWPRFVNLRDYDEALRVMLEGKGAIMVTGHYGPFELSGHVLAALGFDMVAVMRPLDNVFLNRWLVKTRSRHGLSLLDKKGATQHAEEILRRGALLSFIGDQDAGSQGIFVDFFGRPASTYKSIGLLAMMTETPIIVGYARRTDPGGRYEVGVQRVIRPREWEEKDDPLRWITETYTAAIEEFARESPEQYLWIHRRWKTTPESARERRRARRQRAMIK